MMTAAPHNWIPQDHTGLIIDTTGIYFPRDYKQ